jgi:hypothetical protein
MARNRCRTTLLAELFNDRVSIRLPLECQHLDFYYPGNELKAEALKSHLVDTEEFRYSQDRPCSLARRLRIELTGYA